MTKDVRAGDLDLLPFVFQALGDFEVAVEYFRHLEPKNKQGWIENRSWLLNQWETVQAMAASYGATCPNLPSTVEKDKA